MLRKTTKLLLAISVLASQNASANLWREVEIIVFQQLSGQQQLRESFPVEVNPIAINRAGDLVSRIIHKDVKALRDNLTECFADSRLKSPEYLYPLPEIFPLLSEDSELLKAPLSSQASTSELGVEVSFEPSELNTEDQPGNNGDFDNSDEFENSHTTSSYDTAAQHPSSTLETEDAGQQAQQLFAEFEPVRLNQNLDCVYAEELAYFSDLINPLLPATTEFKATQVPRELFAPRIGDNLGYAMPKEYAKLNDIVRNIHRSRTMRLMLHTVWRQNIEFGRKARSYRLFAGQDYSDTYNYQGFPLAYEALNTIDSSAPSELPVESAIEPQQPQTHQQFIDGIRQAIANAGPEILEEQLVEVPMALPQATAGQPEQVWQLDGKYRLYLKNVNRVPYMFLDWDMNYRSPGKLPEKFEPLKLQLTEFNAAQLAAEYQGLESSETTEPVSTLQQVPQAQPQLEDDYLYAYGFQQSRRLISKEVHYFDHPYFGIILQIRRFLPDLEDEAIINPEQHVTEPQ